MTRALCCSQRPTSANAAVRPVNSYRIWVSFAGLPEGKSKYTEAEFRQALKGVLDHVEHVTELMQKSFSASEYNRLVRMTAQDARSFFDKTVARCTCASREIGRHNGIHLATFGALCSKKIKSAWMRFGDTSRRLCLCGLPVCVPSSTSGLCRISRSR